MPKVLERILVKLETGQFVINLGGDIGIGATTFRRRERNGAEAAFPLVSVDVHRLSGINRIFPV